MAHFLPTLYLRLKKQSVTNLNLYTSIKAKNKYKTLEAFSLYCLELVEWRPDETNNVEVLNETIDLYRYFDATKQAEFLYSCVQQTVEHTIPEEVDNLEKYAR